MCLRRSNCGVFEFVRAVMCVCVRMCTQICNYVCRYCRRYFRFVEQLHKTAHMDVAMEGWVKSAVKSYEYVTFNAHTSLHVSVSHDSRLNSTGNIRSHVIKCQKVSSKIVYRWYDST